MKFANLGGRATLVVDGRAVDVATASDGRFGPDPMSVYDDWAAFVRLRRHGQRRRHAPRRGASSAARCPHPARCSPSGSTTGATPRSRAWRLPEVPGHLHQVPGLASSGPFDDIEIVERHGRLGGRAGRGDRRRVPTGWPRPTRGRHVAGLTVGQDISDRTMQFAAGAQFSLGKSHRGYGPMGPWLVTPDEVADPDDLALGCSVDGETVQDARTSDLVFAVPELVAELSAVLPLLPGDLIFTGTPAGVGVTRKPARFLAARRGARDLDRGHRHDPQPLRLSLASHTGFARGLSPTPPTSSALPPFGKQC